MGKPKIGIAERPSRREAQKAYNYRKSREIEQSMQDEGDMLVPTQRPVIDRWVALKCLIAAAVIYGLLVAALVLVRG